MHCAYCTSLVEFELPPLEPEAEPELLDEPPQAATTSPSAANATNSTHFQFRDDSAGDLPPVVARILSIPLTSFACFDRGWTLRWIRYTKAVVTPRSAGL